jgi:hypothetical protein
MRTIMDENKEIMRDRRQTMLEAIIMKESGELG